MITNYPSIISKTICFDLFNKSFYELQNLTFIKLINNTFFCFLFIKYKTLHTDLLLEERTDLTYLEEDFITGSKRRKDNYMNFSSGRLEILTKSNITKNDNLHIEIESTLIKNKSLYLKPLSLYYFKNTLKKPTEKETLSIVFVNLQLEASTKLFLIPKQVIKQFNVSKLFLDSKIKLKNILLKTIYFKNHLPILFIYIDEKKVFMGWDKYYLVALEKLNSVHVKSDGCESILYTILDKINIIGFKNLKSKELAFLNYYSNL